MELFILYKVIMNSGYARGENFRSPLAPHDRGAPGPLLLFGIGIIYFI
jgi:hypothetical protein